MQISFGKNNFQYKNALFRSLKRQYICTFCEKRHHIQEYKWKPVLRIRDVYPWSGFFPSRIQICPTRIPDPHQSILTENTVSSLSEIWTGLSSPDLDPDFVPIPDPGIKKAQDPGSATLVETYVNISSTLYTVANWTYFFHIGQKLCNRFILLLSLWATNSVLHH